MKSKKSKDNIYLAAPEDWESENLLLESDENQRLIAENITSRPVVKSTSFQTFFTLAKSFIGSGVLSLAYSYKNAGSGVSIIMTIIIGILTYYCTYLILDVADHKTGREKITYARIAFDELKKFGMYSVEISIVIMQVGVCIGVFIIAKKFLEHAFCIYEVQDLCGNQTFIIALCALVTIPLSFINNVHYFYIPNLIAFIFLIIGLGTQTFYNISVLVDKPNVGDVFKETLGTFNLEGLPLLFGVAIYAFEGIGTIFDIRDSMAKPQHFQRLFRVNTVFLMIVYTIFPLICVVAVENLPEIVLFALPKSNYFFLLVQIGYVFSCLLGYPTGLYPAIRIMENSKFLRGFIFDERGNTTNPILRYGFRVLLISLMLFIANITKSFNLFLNFLGSCVFTYIGYLLPIWIYNRYFKERIKSGQLILNWVSFVLGVVFGITGIVFCLKKFMS